MPNNSILDSNDRYNPDSIVYDNVSNTDNIIDPSTSVSKSTEPSVLIFYGNGAELGDFSIYAESLKNELLSSYSDSNVQIIKSFNRNELVNGLISCGLKNIKEIHIFSHSAGAGLFLGYHIESYVIQREDFLYSNPNPTYEEVVDNEISALLTDHLITTYSSIQIQIRALLKNVNFVKLWGCNAGVSNWHYDSTNPYWNALNLKNTPKPSIAKCIATYIQKTVYGAKSGSHVEYKISGKWISGFEYARKYKKPYPSDYESIRLHPDRGDYFKFAP